MAELYHRDAENYNNLDGILGLTITIYFYQ
jgi:hypothetical protein